MKSIASLHANKQYAKKKNQEIISVMIALNYVPWS